MMGKLNDLDQYLLEYHAEEMEDFITEFFGSLEVDLYGNEEHKIMTSYLDLIPFFTFNNDYVIMEITEKIVLNFIYETFLADYQLVPLRNPKMRREDEKYMREHPKGKN